MERQLINMAAGHCLPGRENFITFDQAQWHKIFDAESLCIVTIFIFNAPVAK
jgi:hypothetical protein